MEGCGLQHVESTLPSIAVKLLCCELQQILSKYMFKLCKSGHNLYFETTSVLKLKNVEGVDRSTTTTLPESAT